MGYIEMDCLLSVTEAAHAITTKIKFDTVVELYKCGVMPEEDFLKMIEPYTNEVPFDIEYFRGKQIEKLKQRMLNLNRAYKINNLFECAHATDLEVKKK